MEERFVVFATFQKHWNVDLYKKMQECETSSFLFNFFLKKN